MSNYIAEFTNLPKAKAVNHFIYAANINGDKPASTAYEFPFHKHPTQEKWLIEITDMSKMAAVDMGEFAALNLSIKTTEELEALNEGWFDYEEL